MWCVRTPFEANVFLSGIEDMDCEPSSHHTFTILMVNHVEICEVLAFLHTKSISSWLLKAYQAVRSMERHESLRTTYYSGVPGIEVHLELNLPCSDSNFYVFINQIIHWSFASPRLRNSGDISQFVLSGGPATPCLMI